MNFERLKKIAEAKSYNKFDIKPWQQLEIHEEIWEWDNKRIWRFKGLVIKVKRPNSPEWTFTIRGVAAWVEVEKIYPLSFPKFKKLILLDEYKIRRAKLYYIREKVWKDARFKSKITAAKRGLNLLNKTEKVEVTDEVSNESESK